jgi:hypothetical protein
MTIKEQKEVDKARALLSSYGYQTDNLWHIDDVKGKFKCSDDEAMEVLIGALQNDATMEQIWLSIDVHGENEGFERIEGE